MEHIQNISSETSTDEPVSPSNSNTLAGSLESPLSQRFGDAAADAVDSVAWRVRQDGWTADRIRVFLNTLAQSGSVTDASRAAGISFQSAYRLRNRAAGRAFHLAWNAAMLLARRRLADDLLSRAVNGCREVVYRDGRVVAERHRHDNRLGLALLQRLDRQAKESEKTRWSEEALARIVAEEFYQFVDIVCEGGEAAAGFIEARRDSYAQAPEPELLDRLDNYRNYGVGHAEEIDVSDLDIAEAAKWTEEQRLRAERAGLIEVESDDSGDSAAARAIKALLAGEGDD